MDVLTHIAYALPYPRRTADCSLESPETAVLPVKDAHKSQVKVLLAVGGWSYNGAELEPVFVSATSASEKPGSWAMKYCHVQWKYGFDSVDIGLGASQGRPALKDIEYQGFDSLPQKRAPCKEASDPALSSVGQRRRQYCYDAATAITVLNAVDWIHVMAYDGAVTGTPILPMTFTVNSAAYWCGTRKNTGGKVVLGVPFHGRPAGAGYGDIWPLAGCRE